MNIMAWERISWSVRPATQIQHDQIAPHANTLYPLEPFFSHDCWLYLFTLLFTLLHYYDYFYLPSSECNFNQNEYKWHYFEVNCIIVFLFFFKYRTSTALQSGDWRPLFQCMCCMYFFSPYLSGCLHFLCRILKSESPPSAAWNLLGSARQEKYL